MIHSKASVVCQKNETRHDSRVHGGGGAGAAGGTQGVGVKGGGGGVLEKKKRRQARKFVGRSVIKPTHVVCHLWGCRPSQVQFHKCFPVIFLNLWEATTGVQHVHGCGHLWSRGRIIPPKARKCLLGGV
jgi:hypothetical protein